MGRRRLQGWHHTDRLRGADNNQGGAAQLVRAEAASISTIGIWMKCGSWPISVPIITW